MSIGEKIFNFVIFGGPIIYGLATGLKGIFGVTIGALSMGYLFIQYGGFVEFAYSMLGFNYGKYKKQNKEKREIQDDRKDTRRKFKLKYKD